MKITKADIERIINGELPKVNFPEFIIQFILDSVPINSSDMTKKEYVNFMQMQLKKHLRLK